MAMIDVMLNKVKHLGMRYQLGEILHSL